MRIWFSLIAVLCMFTSAQAAVITPAFGKWSSAGGSVDAGKQNVNTMQVLGATFSKPGGKPTMTIPTAATELTAAAEATPADSATFGFLDSVFKRLTWANLKAILRGGVAYDTDYANLNAAVTAIGSTPRTLKITTDQTLTANLTIPANIELLPLNGAVINHGAYIISGPGMANTARWPLARIVNGTGLVSGLKMSRPEWFGAARDGVADDSAAITKAAASLDSGGLFSYSPGSYGVGSTWVIDKIITVRGAGQNSTFLNVLASMDAVISAGTVGGATSVRLNIAGINITGNGLADYGIYGYTALSIIEQNYVSGTIVSAMALEGWSSRITNNTLTGNTGDGVQTIGRAGYCQNLVLSTNKIYANGGWGFFVGSGSGNTVLQNNTIENNDKGAAYIWGNVYLYNIDKNYLEVNASVGHTFTTPSFNVKTNILVNGSPDPSVFAPTYPPNVNMTNNHVTGGDSLAFVTSTSMLNVEGNNNQAGTRVLVATYGNPSGIISSYGSLSNAAIGLNQGFTSTVSYTYVGVDGVLRCLDSLTIKGVSKRNIAKTVLSGWTKVIDNGAASTFAVSAIAFSQDPTRVVYELIDADSAASDVYGFSIDASKYPQLHGKYMSFSAWIKATGSGNVNLYVKGVAGSAVAYSAGWVKSTNYIFVMPTTGTLVFGIAKDSAGSTAQVTAPVLAEYGNSVDDLMAVIP